MTDLRTAAQQALEALYEETAWFGPTPKGAAAITALRAALAEPVQEHDLSRCPKCGGPADNGHDREVPPNPYYCTKCMAEPVAWRWGYRSVTTGEMDWRGYVEIPAHPNLRSPAIIMEPLYTAPPQRPAEPVQEPVAWLRVIDEAMVTHHLGVADPTDDYETAKRKMNNLLCAAQDIGTYFAKQAGPVQEPIGYLWPTGRHPEFRFTQQKRDGIDGTPVYTSPPQRPPLTEEEIEGGSMKDEIIKMAREASEETNWKPALGNEHVVDFLERFFHAAYAAGAAAERDKYEAKFKQLEALMQVREQQPNKPCCLAEREACAKVCASLDETDMRSRYDYRRGVLDCVDAIRARGKQNDL